MNTSTSSARQTRKVPAAPPPEHQEDPRRPTKRDRVLALLERPEGASVEAIVDTTGWLPHTVRAFLTGLRKQGRMLERTRTKDGPGTYRIAGEVDPTPATPTAGH